METKKVVCSFVPKGKTEKKALNCGFATNFTLKLPENYKANLNEDLVEEITKYLNTTKESVNKLLISDLNLAA